jgi:predicted AlkP superfamily phosphohydrolase/phosphomutase
MNAPGFALVCAIALACGCSWAPSGSKFPQVVVIGVDGMDPGFIESHWDALPTMRRLRDAGGFRRLKTTTPPQSPVAWSTFITGLDPGGHGIYDFVHRDPKTLAPYSSFDRTESPRFSLPLGPWVVPLSKPRVVSLRRGIPFWRVLADRGVPVTTMRMPTNYPPVNAGRALAGMGVPDLRGSFGTFALYTDDPEEITRNVAGGRIVKVALEKGRVTLSLEGPPNSLRKDRRISSVPMVVDIDSSAKAARLSIGDALAIVKQGEWSQWISAKFPQLPYIASVTGLFRVYAKELVPRFQLYITPVNIDPRHPALPIAVPEGFSRDISDEIGPFYTQGIPEDTSALREGAFTLKEFLEQSRLVFEDERRLLRYAVRHFQNGLLFSYFSVIDQNAHVLWARHDAELLKTYREIDELIGEAMRALPAADFIVMSDHGFTRFNRSFQLNAWLKVNGFLALNGPEGSEGFKNVDWTKTQAYGLGLNGLYVNLRGREAKGIVAREQKAAVLNRIAAALVALRDPRTGERVVQSVARPPESETAPDLIVGYSPGYRASWDTALGGTASPVLQDNNDPWIGDHCVDAAAVPGVLFSTRPIHSNHPELRDLPGAILRLFGEQAPSSMSAGAIY